ncbi:MAG: hypothetical protein N2747_00310 [Chitinophagaceae bacterium]|nr:hypothetical protein [Chitinophagaceae bacterium]
MKNNTLQELNNNLFDQLRRLNSDMSAEELKQEIERAKAMSALGTLIVNNSKVVLSALRLKNSGQSDEEDTEKLLGL